MNRLRLFFFLLVSLFATLLISPHASAQEYSFLGEAELSATVMDNIGSILLKSQLNLDAQHTFQLTRGKFFIHHAVSADSQEHLRSTLYEAYLDLNLLPSLVLMAGKQILSWGSGYSYSPADSLNPQPSGPSQKQQGFKGVSLNFAPTADFSLTSALSLDNALGMADKEIARGLKPAAYLSWLLGQTEMTASFVYEWEDTLRPGLSVSLDLWGFILGMEGAVEFDNRAFYPDLLSPGNFKQQPAGDPYPLVDLTVQRDFSFEGGSASLVLEYFYYAPGYSRAQRNSLYDLIKLYGQAAAFGSGFSLPRFLGQNYLAPVIGLSIDGLFATQHGLLLCLDDGSFLATHGISIIAFSGLDLDLGFSWLFGEKNRTVFGLVPERWNLTLATVIHI